MANFMNVAELAATRSPDAKLRLDIDERELCDRYARTYTGAINDVLREFMLMNQTLPITLRPLRAEMVMAGVAFTIRSARDPGMDLDGEMQQRASASPAEFETFYRMEMARWKDLVQSRGMVAQ